MENQKTSLDTLYIVNKTNKKISIEIITGGIGQTSTINASIDGIFDENANGYLPETIINSNKNLEGKTLIISCTITDTSREINYTELRIRLKGGLLYAEYPLFASVENEGDTISYRCIIRFYNPS